MSRVRVAVIGAGHLGRIHTRILASLADFELIGVVDPVESARAALATAHQIRACSCHEELIDDVDAVVIAAPTPLHLALGQDCLRRGKHALIEKPLAPTRRESQELVETAHRSQVALQVGHVERFNPAFLATQDSLHDAKYVECVRRGPFTFRSTDVGVVLDLMIHDLDLVLSLTDSKPRQVDALGVALFGEHEDVAQARVTFENGCVANFTACRASHAVARSLQAWTLKDWVQLDFQAKSATIVRPSEAILHRELDVAAWSPAEKAAAKDGFMNEHLPQEQPAIAPGDAITAELLDFADSIRTGRNPRVSGEAGRDAVALAEEILSKIATHRWEGDALGPIGPRAVPSPVILPGPHWQLPPATRPHRRAG